MTVLISSHRFERMTEEMRPQDPTMNGSTMRFETFEHGGEYPDMMPQAIKVTDDSGNWCIYHPTTEHGEVVRSLGYGLNQEKKPTQEQVEAAIDEWGVDWLATHKRDAVADIMALIERR